MLSRSVVARIKWLKYCRTHKNHRTINARSRFTHGKWLKEESEATIKNNILYNPNERQGGNTETGQNLAPKKSENKKKKISTQVSKLDQVSTPNPQRPALQDIKAGLWFETGPNQPTGTPFALKRCGWCSEVARHRSQSKMSHQTRSRKAPTDRHTRPSREIGGSSSSCKCLRHRFVYWSPLWTNAGRVHIKGTPRKQAKTEHSGLARTLTTDTRTGSRVRFQALGCRAPCFALPHVRSCSGVQFKRSAQGMTTMCEVDLQFPQSWRLITGTV